MKGQQFSVRKYGEAEAYRLAVGARRQLLAAVEGVAVYHPELRKQTPAAADVGDEVIRPPIGKNAVPNPCAAPRTGEIDGVSRARVKTTLKDGTVTVTHYWVALFANPGGTPKRRSRYFSIARHGEEEARRLAIEQRGIWESGQDTALLRGVRGVFRASRKMVCKDGTVSVDAHWIASIETGGQSKRRFFSVKRFGDEEARRLAIEQRRFWENGEDASPLGTLPGVFLRHTKYARQDGTVVVKPYWTASFSTPNGRVLRRAFSVKRFGDEEARRLAIEQRRAWEREAGERGEPRKPSRGS